MRPRGVGGPVVRSFRNWRCVEIAFIARARAFGQVYIMYILCIFMYYHVISIDIKIDSLFTNFNASTMGCWLG